MVKIKAICRDENDYKRKTNTEIEKVFRNPKPTLHPFQKAREFTRALNAVKLEKVFSKPFLFALGDHTDGIKCLAKNTKSLSDMVSGGFDGQIVFWGLSDKKAIYNINSNHNFVKGLCFSNSGEEFLSCGDDMTISLWNKTSLASQKLQFLEKSMTDNDTGEIVANFNYKPKNMYKTDSFLDNIDHSYYEKLFATSGGVVAIWNYERSQPLHKFTNCSDGFLKVKFNCIEPNILLATGYDRSICLYDIRTNNPLKSVTLKNKSSAACWNPQEAFTFTVGNEDSNCYTFDMRQLDNISLIHKDNILAILDLDYSPTGKEFVTGSYDKTIRIFNSQSGRSREVYHTKRMQKIYSVLYTMDEKYVISGSDDTNIRFWKAVANDSIKLLNVRERESLEYKNKLVEKYKYNPEIKRIKRHKHIPKYILNRKNVLHIKNQSKHRKLKNMALNNKPGTIEHEAERKSKIVKNSIIDK